MDEKALTLDLSNLQKTKISVKHNDDDIRDLYLNLSDMNIIVRFKEKYKDLLEKQYQNLSYKIKDEEIEKDTATVVVEIEVLDYKTAINKVKEYKNDKECVTYFNRKDHLWTLYQYETGDFIIPENAREGMIYEGCNCGNCHITILPTGEVYACRRVSDSKVGNVFEDRLKDLWIKQVEKFYQIVF